MNMNIRIRPSHLVCLAILAGSFAACASDLPNANSKNAPRTSAGGAVYTVPHMLEIGSVTGFAYSGPYMPGTTDIPVAFAGYVPIAISGMAGQRNCGVGLVLQEAGQAPMWMAVAGPSQPFPVTILIPDPILNGRSEVTLTFRAVGWDTKDKSGKAVPACNGKTDDRQLHFVRRSGKVEP